MKRFLLTGSDTSKVQQEFSKLLDSYGSPRVYRLPDDESFIFESLNTQSLFGRSVIFISSDILSTEFVDRLIKSLDSDNDVIIKVDSITAAVKKRVEKIFSINEFNIPGVGGMARYIKEIAAEHSVTLDNVVVDELVSRVGNDVDVIRNIIKSCAIAKINKPSNKQILFLLGSSLRDSEPWDVFNLVVKGRGKEAITTAGSVDEFALLGYFNKRAFDALLLQENGVTNKDDAAKLLGITPWLAESVYKLSLHDGEKLLWLIQAATTCERLLKTGEGRERLDLFLHDAVITIGKR